MRGGMAGCPLRGTGRENDGHAHRPTVAADGRRRGPMSVWVEVGRRLGSGCVVVEGRLPNVCAADGWCVQSR